jgi:putative Mn2+ efflux pump MntP
MKLLGGFRMHIISILGIAIGLSMDAFAVSIAKGMCLKRDIAKTALRLAFWFGLFQAVMPYIGWSFGKHFQDMIVSIDHWIAFFLLSFIGIRMILDVKKQDSQEEDPDISTKAVLLLAIATSIDALAVGVSFAFLQVDIYEAIFLIGCTTFILSFAAVYIGNKIGGFCQSYAGILGGIILIFIGIKILIEHLLGA